MTRSDLRLRPLLKVWAPLAVTFLLVTGGTPVINASVNRLPGRDHEADLAAFALFLTCTIVLHSPLFVAREIAIKLSVDRRGARVAMLFCTSVAAVLALFEWLMGATALGPFVLSAFADDPALVREAHRAFLYIWPMPLFIAVRGVYQAHQIRADDTLFVGLGTLARLLFTALLGLAIAPDLGVSGPVLGAICMVIGVVLETIFAMARAGAAARPPERSEERPPHPLTFGLPLMFASFLGLLATLYHLRIAGMVPASLQTASLAAFQEAKPLTFVLGSGAVALQSLTTAKVRGRADEVPMLRFAWIVGGAMSLVFGLLVFTPLRRVVLVDLMGEEPHGQVLAFARPTLMLAVVLPLWSSLRFVLRGILISRGHTRAITLTNIATLLLLSAAVAIGVRPFGVNGALNAYALWLLTIAMELLVLWRAAARGAPRGELLPAAPRTPREATGG